MRTLFQVDPSVTLNQPTKRIPYFASVWRAWRGKMWRMPRLKSVSRPLRTLKKVTISGIRSFSCSSCAQRGDQCADGHTDPDTDRDVVHGDPQRGADGDAQRNPDAGLRPGRPPVLRLGHRLGHRLAPRP